MAPKLIFCYMSIINNLVMTLIARSVFMDPKDSVIMRLTCIEKSCLGFQTRSQHEDAVHLRKTQNLTGLKF